MVLDSLFNKEIRTLKKAERLYEKGARMANVNDPQGKSLALEALNLIFSSRDLISSKTNDFSLLLSKIGALISRYGDFKNADEAFKMAMSLNGKNIDAYINFAESLAQRKDYDRALKMTERALLIDRRNKRAWETKASIYEIIGDIDEAIKVYRGLIALYPENLEYYEKYLKYKPDDYEILYKKGKILYKKGDLKGATDSFEEVVKHKPDHKNAYLYLGAAYHKLDRLDDSIRAFKKVITLDHKNKAAWFNLAIIYEKKKKYDDALESIREAVKIDPNDPKVWYRRASIEKNMGSYAQALISINRAVEIKKDFVDAFLLKREILKKIYDPKEMVDTCSSLINLGRMDVDIYHDLAKAYFDMKDYTNALKVTEAILSRIPNDLTGLKMQRDIMKIQGRWNEVISLCQKILKISQKDVECLLDQATAYENLGKLESTLNILKKATDLAPNNMDIWMKRKNVAKKLNRPDEVIAASLPIIEKIDDLETYIDLGKAYYVIQRFDESRKILERALKIGENDELWYNLGKTYYKLHNLEDAARSFRKASEINPKEKKYWSSLGWVYEKLEKYREAIDAFDRAIDIDSGDMRIWYERGICLEKIGEREKALKSFDVALKINPKFTKALFEKANLLLELGSLEDSLDAFNKLLHLDPANHLAFYKRALVRFKLKNYESCLKDINNALKYEKREDYYELRKDCCKEMKNWNCVVDSARRIIEINRKNLSAYRDLAKGYINLGKVESAVEAYRDALEVFPDEDVLLYELKDLLKKEGRNGEVVNVAKKILELHPDDFNNLLDLSGALISLDRYRDAENYLLRALDIKKTKEVYDLLGNLYSKLEDYKSAIKYYKESLKLQDDPEVRYFVAKCYYKLNNYDTALKEIRKALRKNKAAKYYLLASKIAMDKGDTNYALKYGREALKLQDSPEVRLLLSEVLLSAGEYEEIIHILKDLAKSGNLKALQILGDALEKSGRYDDAIAIYDRIVEIDENNINALKGLARIYLKKKDLENARNVLENLVKIVPENKEVNEDLAFVYSSLGEYEKALKYINQAIILDPENKFFYNSKGLILLNMKLYDDAKKAFEKALSIDPEFRDAMEGLKDCERKIEEQEIEKYARKVLDWEHRTGKKVSKKVAFKDLGIPLGYIPKVFEYIESEEPFDPAALEEERKEKFERVSLYLARKINKIDGLSLADIIANTNLNIRSAKRLLRYIEFCLGSEFDEKTTPEDEHLVRRILDQGIDSRRIVNIMVGLDVGICKAKKLQTLYRKYFGEEMSVVGEQEDVVSEETPENEEEDVIVEKQEKMEMEDRGEPEDREDMFL